MIRRIQRVLSWACVAGVVGAWGPATIAFAGEPHRIGKTQSRQDAASYLCGRLVSGPQQDDVTVPIAGPSTDQRTAGVLFSPRVVSPHRADAYSMKTFAEFPRWRDLKGDALAYEVYKYLVDTRSGIFHMNVVNEGVDDLSEFTHVRDPVKIINVYGYGFCGIFGPVMAGVCEDMGIGKSRSLTLPAWNHVATETFYDDKWHYLDVDVRAVFRRDDGSLASMDDARRDATLWRGPSGPLFFPNNSLERTRRIYETTPVHRYHGFNQTGHTMDYVLRPGETLTRWWQPQGGRWNHSPAYQSQDWLLKLIESEPRGPKPNHRHFTVHNHGNGRFVYTPNLTDRSSDFGSGVDDCRNVQPTKQGLTLREGGEGFATFEFRSPYVIVPRVGELATTRDDCEASVVEIDASGASLEVSTDNRLTWHDVAFSGGKATIDLTPLVGGHYGYLLRIRLRGEPEKASVRSLRVTTWVQVAPASLPALGPGRNRCEFRTGDHYGMNTRVLEVRSQASRPEELLKYLTGPPADYDPKRKTGKIVGPITVQLNAPPGTRIAWLTASGQFRTHQQDEARKTRNSIAYACELSDNFQTIYQAGVPTYVNHWHYNAAGEVKLNPPAKSLFVRYVGDPAINNFVIFAHCVEDQPTAAPPVRITHTWTENGQPRTFTATAEGPTSYDIETRGEPVNESIEIAVPSATTG